MTTVIYKFPINPPRYHDGRTTIDLPCDYKILSAGFMHNTGTMCVWVQMTKEPYAVPYRRVYIEVYGTGTEVNDPTTLTFIDTVHVDPSSALPEIFHVYQRINKFLD